MVWNLYFLMFKYNNLLSFMIFLLLIFKFNSYG